MQVGNSLVGSAKNDVFGCAVALSSDGKTLAVGANQNGTYNSKINTWRPLGDIVRRVGGNGFLSPLSHCLRTGRLSRQVLIGIMTTAS